MHTKSKHHDKLITIAAVFALLAVAFVLWQWKQFPHEAFMVNETSLTIPNKDVTKKPQPKMPEMNTTKQP